MSIKPITTKKTKFDGLWKPSKFEKKYASFGNRALTKKQKLIKSQKIESGVLIFDFLSFRITKARTKRAQSNTVHLSVGLKFLPPEP